MAAPGVERQTRGKPLGHRQVAPIEKSPGLTESERLLADLCQHTFLSLWSYPNLFRAPGQELCDVLVVFDEHLIIFSDKSCKFPDTGDAGLDWMRWYDRAIDRSARQVFGAERWIKTQPDRIFLDAACTKRFPLKLPDPAKLRVHRVVVALNAGERCKAYFGKDGLHGGSGSLMFLPALSGKADPARPFAVGTVYPDRGLVHVLDDFTLHVLMKELDTISDLTSYLSKKEAFIAADGLALSHGEEELLCYYLFGDGSGERGFFLREDHQVVVESGHWEGISTHPLYLAKKEVDRVSYGWDTLIETFGRQYLNDTLLVGGNEDINDFQAGLAIMAKMPRAARRWLANSFKEHLANCHRRGLARGQAYSRFIEWGDVGYVFEVMDAPPKARMSEVADAEFRLQRRIMAQAACLTKKAQYPSLAHVVGIACESTLVGGRPIDLVYFDVGKMSEADIAELRQEVTRAGMPPKPLEPARTAGNRKQRRAMRAAARKKS
ncbi:MAG TPA: hypothetical protein VKX28_07910 [Xanthobacteraceae bacterium]|nr:hypothetical protein [Xanthobacteraceae bacterium]